MSGVSRVLLDTNAIVSLLAGNAEVAQMVQVASWVGISVIAHLEFLGHQGLTRHDESLFATFISRVETVGLGTGDPPLLRQVVALRRATGLKLPDAIVAATAIRMDAHLITRDTHFGAIPGLTVHAY